MTPSTRVGLPPPARPVAAAAAAATGVALAAPGAGGDLVARVAAATRLLHGLERARQGLLDAVAGARASSRLPAVAELALTALAIAALRVVRHLTRLARRGGPLGRATPAVVEARKTAVSRASAGEMLRQLAASGGLVELTGSRSHRAYVPRDLAELGIDVRPARLWPAPGRGRGGAAGHPSPALSGRAQGAARGGLYRGVCRSADCRESDRGAAGRDGPRPPCRA